MWKWILGISLIAVAAISCAMWLLKPEWFEERPIYTREIRSEKLYSGDNDVGLRDSRFGRKGGQKTNPCPEGEERGLWRNCRRDGSSGR